MRSYLMDEIAHPDMQRIRAFLKENAVRSSLDQIFWVRIPDDLLSQTQFQHNRCQPHVFAVETGPDWIKLELFVRTLESLRCDCPAYATPAQRDYILRFGDGIMNQLQIQT